MNFSSFWSVLYRLLNSILIQEGPTFIILGSFWEALEQHSYTRRFNLSSYPSISFNILRYPSILMIWETFYHIFKCFREPIGRTSRRVLSSSGVHFGTLFIIDLAPRSKYVIICKNINCPSGRILLIHLCRANTPTMTSWWGHIFPAGARAWLVLNAIEVFQK